MSASIKMTSKMKAYDERAGAEAAMATRPSAPKKAFKA
jgi:hypothetical protein